MTSYFALRSPAKSCAFMISWLMPYCSSIHICQPPGMLPAPFHSPTFVAGFSRTPSTAGGAIRTPPTATPNRLRRTLDDRLRRRRRRNHPRARRELLRARFEAFGGAIHGHVRLLQLRHHLEEPVASGSDRGTRPSASPPRFAGTGAIFFCELELRVERLVGHVDGRAGQHPQRVAGDVIRRLGRTAREEAQVGIHLLLEHGLGKAAVRLRGLDHERSRRRTACRWR